MLLRYVPSNAWTRIVLVVVYTLSDMSIWSRGDDTAKIKRSVFVWVSVCVCVWVTTTRLTSTLCLWSYGHYAECRLSRSHHGMPSHIHTEQMRWWWGSRKEHSVWRLPKWFRWCDCESVCRRVWWGYALRDISAHSAKEDDASQPKAVPSKQTARCTCIQSKGICVRALRWVLSALVVLVVLVCQTIWLDVCFGVPRVWFGAAERTLLLRFEVFAASAATVMHIWVWGAPAEIVLHLSSRFGVFAEATAYDASYSRLSFDKSALITTLIIGF